MMKEPNKSDFDVKVGVGTVEVTFKPTSTHFTYNSATVLVDPGDNTPPTILTSSSGDTYWSNAVQATARRLAEKRLPWRRRTKTLIGAAIGAVFGLIYTILVINQTPDRMYVPQTTGGVVAKYFIELIPSALLGAAIGFFWSIAMSKTSKLLVGLAVGAGFGLVTLLVLAALGAPSWSLAEVLIVVVPWALIWAAIGFFSGQRRPGIESGIK